jgi:hypothetical protein
MRRIAMSVAIIGLGALISAGDARTTNASAAPKCHLASGERVVARNSVGLVSSRSKPIPRRPRYSEETETVWRACLNSVGRRLLIGRTTKQSYGGNFGHYGMFRIAGRYVTFEGRWGSRYGMVASEVEQYDLRSGRSTLSAKYGLDDEIVAESGLVVNARGDAAWLVDVGADVGVPDGPGSVDVIAHDRIGTQLLASYPVQLDGAWPLPVTGLAVTPSRVSWRYGTEEQVRRSSSS